MQGAITLLIGFLAGGLIVHMLIAASERRKAVAHDHDDQHCAVLHAAIKHLRAHGTVNRTQLARMMDIPLETAARYLDRLVLDGVVRPQRHLSAKLAARRGRVFYTKA